MPHSISITGLANNASMPTSVSGTINLVVGLPKNPMPEMAEDAMVEGEPTPGPMPVIQVMICVYDQNTNSQIGQAANAQVMGSTWSCSSIPPLPNGTYKLYAILNYDQEPATSDSRTGLHKP